MDKPPAKPKKKKHPWRVWLPGAFASDPKRRPNPVKDGRRKNS